MTAPHPAPDRRSLRRAYTASLSGTALEYYDFAAYSVAAATIFGDLFFPSGDKLVGTMAAFSTYAIGYLARPLGGFVFGRLGDVIGRKKVLVYTLLLAGPVPVMRDDSAFVLVFPFVAANPWGMSLFITAPCFMWLAGLRYRDGTSRLILLTILLTALPILFYYGIGYRQFGYRYSLDFLPLLFYLLLRNYRMERGGLTTGFKALVVASAVLNLHLFAGHFIWHVS